MFWDGIYVMCLIRPRIAVIGTGLAGLSCAQTLQRAGYQVSCFDKARGVGGRLSSRRTEQTVFDHGSPYFEVNDAGFGHQIQVWQQQGAVSEWHTPIAEYQAGQWGPIEHASCYVGTPQMNTMARCISADLPCYFRHHLLQLRHDGHQWTLHFKDQQDHHADQVILAMPAPQVASLLEQTHPFITQVQSVVMQPLWVLMLELMHMPVLPHASILMLHDPVLRLVIQNHQKPNRPNIPTLVLHGDLGWSMQHVDADPAWIAKQMILAFEEMIAQPLQIKSSMTHCWRYALNTPSLAIKSLYDHHRGLGIAGDWLCGSTVEDAWCSGQHLAHTMMAMDPSRV